MIENDHNYFNYFTEIEEGFIRLRGKHIVLSPLDWSLIETWRAMGVPLHVAIRGIERSMELQRLKAVRHRLVNSLFYCNQAVLDEFENYLLTMGGQAAEAPEEAAAPAPSEAPAEPAEHRCQVEAVLDRLLAEVQKLAEGTAGFGVSEAAGRVTQRLAALRAEVGAAPRVDSERLDRDLQSLEALLLPVLEDSLPDAVRKEIDRQCRQELKQYRQNLAPEMYDKIMTNFRMKRIREHFRLPDFSLLGWL